MFIALLNLQKKNLIFQKNFLQNEYSIPFKLYFAENITDFFVGIMFYITWMHQRISGEVLSILYPLLCNIKDED